jgi:hypothetical protein
MSPRERKLKGHRKQNIAKRGLAQHTRPRVSTRVGYCERVASGMSAQTQNKNPVLSLDISGSKNGKQLDLAKATDGADVLRLDQELTTRPVRAAVLARS